MQTIKLWSIHWAKFKQHVHYYFSIIRSWPAIISLQCACEHVMFSTNCSSPSSGCPIKAQEPITESASARSGQTSFRPSALTPPLIGRSISIQVQHLNKAMKGCCGYWLPATCLFLRMWCPCLREQIDWISNSGPHRVTHNQCVTRWPGFRHYYTQKIQLDISRDKTDNLNYPSQFLIS